MAEIDLGRVRGEDGSGGGLTFENKIFVYERSAGEGIWYRKLAEHLVEVGIDCLKESVTLVVNAKTIVLTLPEGYRPKKNIMMATSLTYNYHRRFDVNADGTVELRNAASASVTFGTGTVIAARLLFTID